MQSVASVQEALSLLMLVAHNPGLGVTELARRSGNTKARAYRLLTTLEGSGFVQRAREDSSYHLGHATVILGLAAQQQVNVVKAAGVHLQRLGQAFNETVSVLLRDGFERVTVAQLQSTHDLRVHGEVGRRRRLSAGASGKVLLSYASEEIQQAVLNGELPRFTDNTIISKSKLAKELVKVRQNGYAVSDGEMVNGVVAIAAPIFDGAGSVIAALSMNMPASRAPASLERYVQEVMSTAARISADLGWTAPAGEGRVASPSRANAAA